MEKKEEKDKQATELAKNPSYSPCRFKSVKNIA